MAAIDPSIYRDITIVKNGRDIDIRLACTSIDIFESILSPNITAKIEIVNAGGSIKDEKGDKVTLYDGLKIRGGEAVYISIESNSGNNIATEYVESPFYVSSITNLYRSAELEYFTLNLVSKEAIKNEHTFLVKSYDKNGRISDHVNTIIDESFPSSSGNSDIDPTSNKLGFIGNQMKPFEALIKLASKSVGQVTGGNSSAGFFFFQTRTGFKFKSIDAMMKNEPVATFVETDMNKSRVDFVGTPDLPSLDFKMIRYTVENNQHIIDQLRKGAYASTRRFFDPIKQTVTADNNFTGSDYIGKMENLGNVFNPEDLQYDGINFTQLPSRILTETFDRGTLDDKVTKDPTAIDIEQVLSQRKVRYNTFYTQTLVLQIPLASYLEAGQVVKLLFPKINSEGKEDLDSPNLSGIYIITDVRHHFDPTYSLTSIGVARDTFGLTKNS